jgi:hypothetical protein
MKKILFSVMALFGFLLVPAVSSAAMYQYINTDGYVRTSQADTAEQAFGYLSNIAPTSGIIWVNDSTKMSESTRVQI